MGKKYDDDEMKGNYPDYNRFEMRRKPAENPNEAAKPATRASTVPPPSLNVPTPANPDDETPKAPPTPVYLPDGASEPPLPDAIKDTLIQGTTQQ